MTDTTTPLPPVVDRDTWTAEVNELRVRETAHTWEGRAAHGVYYLTHMADPENHWVESDETNNFTWVRFRLDRGSGANPSVTVLETSECNPLIICGFGGNP